MHRRYSTSFVSSNAIVLVACLSLGVALTGCAWHEDTVNAPAVQSAEWPRTIEVPQAWQATGSGGVPTQLTISAEPQRIAALDYESAEVLAEIGLADRLVLVPDAVRNAALGGHVEEMNRVPHTFAVALEVSAEQVIAAGPDLVVTSERHGNVQPIAEVLGQSGVPVLQLPEPWTSLAGLEANIELIGRATGAETEAAGLVEQLGTGLQRAATSVTSAAADAPRVLMLTNQAGRPFVTAGQAFPLELLRLAGAHSVAGELAFDRTGAINAEQVVLARPDGIVLIDMNGTEDRMFAELLSNPAVAALPAVAEGRVLRVQGRQVQALGLTATVAGLEMLTEWVAELGHA